LTSVAAGALTELLPPVPAWVDVGAVVPAATADRLPTTSAPVAVWAVATARVAVSGMGDLLIS
jgi:hypothetical protein